MVCSKCEQFVSDKELDYSVENYGQILCRTCQDKYHHYREHYEKVKKRSTEFAIKLQQSLVKMGFDARLEQYDKHKHIDIAIPSHKLNIEIDGPQHNLNKEQALADLKRTYHSWKQNYFTLRIPNVLVKEEAYITAGFIKEMINSHQE